MSCHSVKRVPPVINQAAHVRELSFEVDPGLTLPALEMGHDRAPARLGPTVVKVGADWDQELAAEKASEELKRSHGRIVLFDPRGLGRTSPRAAGQDQRRSPFGRDWKEAYIALYLDRPLLGQRVADLRSARPHRR